MSSIEVQQFTYRHGDVELAGYMAQPSRYPRGAILIVPTITGPTKQMYDRARWLAALGYSAMVCDIYGKGFVEDMREARTLANELRADAEYYRERFRCALTELRERSKLGNHRIGAIGYGMGGEIVLEMARGGEDIAIVVSFHGLLATPLPAKEEMDISGADCHVHIYSGVLHGFTDINSSSRSMDAVKYDASADRQSKAAMLSMFEEVFETNKSPGQYQ